jgi:hypothetical protein
MYRCDRCGSGFSPIRIGPAAECPRCEERDGIAAPLTLALFEHSPAADPAPKDDQEPTIPSRERSSQKMIVQRSPQAPSEEVAGR